jgi:phosphoribosylanthranilate isomerase
MSEAMWIKICGNTNLEDAMLAAELGADALGFVFAESKRQVTPAQVAEITSRLPDGVERVGVYCSLDPSEIAETSRAAGLTAVQLHADFDEELLRELNKRFAGSMHIIQTLHWTVDKQSPADSASELTSQLGRIAALGIVDRVLIDSMVGGVVGGTGVAFDWTAARQAFASVPGGLRLILAGGLRPDNVARAIGELAPYGVDVSSGVEASAGRKDPERLARFIENARAAANP